MSLRLRGASDMSSGSGFALAIILKEAPLACFDMRCYMGENDL